MIDTALSHRNHRLHANHRCKRIHNAHKLEPPSKNCCWKAKKRRICTSVVQHTHALQPLYSTWTHTRTQMDVIFFSTPAVHMPGVSMCAWVSTFFRSCCCGGNFEYCSLTVKSAIRPLVDLPSVLALKTNNLSLAIESALVSIQVAKTGRLINQASCCYCINFFFASCAQTLRVPCTLFGNHLAVPLWYTHMNDREKKGGKWKKKMSVSHLNQRKGKRNRKKKDLLVMWLSYKRTCKIQWTQQCRHSSKLPASHRFVFNHFVEKKNFKTDQQRSDFKEKTRSNVVSVVYLTKAKKKNFEAQWTMTWSLCVHVDNFFLCVCVVLTYTTENTES